MYGLKDGRGNIALKQQLYNRAKMTKIRRTGVREVGVVGGWGQRDSLRCT